MPITAKPLGADAPIGSHVFVVEDAGSGVTLTVTRSAPWEAPGGHLLAKLRGRPGGYLLGRCFDAAETMSLILDLERAD